MQRLTFAEFGPPLASTASLNNLKDPLREDLMNGALLWMVCGGATHDLFGACRGFGIFADDGRIREPKTSDAKAGDGPEQISASSWYIIYNSSRCAVGI